MFKNPFQVAVIFAVVSLAIKLLVFLLGIQHGAMEQYIFFIYMLILLIAVFFGIRTNKVMYEGNTTFGQDFRTGARTASFYAIIVTLITYVYYAKIDPDFFSIKQKPFIDGLYEAAKSRINIDSKEVILKNLGNAIYSVRLQLSPYAQSMITMFGLVFLGLFNSVVFSFLMKKYPGFKK